LWIGTAIIPAAAQNDPTNEVGLLLGAPFTPELGLPNQPGRISFGSNITFQATYAHRIADLKVAAIYFEFPFAAAPKIGVSSSNNSVPANYASIFITPGLRLKLRPNASVSPWFAAGGGYARFHESAELQDGSPNLGRIGANRGAAQFGGGMDFRTPIKVLFPIGLRVEIRDFYSGKPNYNQPTGGGFQHNLLFSGGLIVSF
jgi:hypothetical protein